MMFERITPATLSLFILSYLPLFSAAAEQQCWYPDGQTPAPDTPCNSNGSPSACCNKLAFCLDNGLCLSGGLVSRGSCTDKSWSDPACATYCTEFNPEGGASLQPCDDGANTWTCGTTNDNCINNQDVFIMQGGDGIVLRASQAAGLQAGPSSVLNVQPTTVLRVEDGGGAGAAASSVSQGTGMYTAGEMAGVGAGVGIPLLLALLVAIFVILWQRRQIAQSMGRDRQGYGAAPPYAQVAGQQGAYVSAAKVADQSPRAFWQRAYPNARRGRLGEMDVGAQMTELGDSTQRQELPATK